MRERRHPACQHPPQDWKSEKFTEPQSRKYDGLPASDMQLCYEVSYAAEMCWLLSYDLEWQAWTPVPTHSWHSVWVVHGSQDTSAYCWLYRQAGTCKQAKANQANQNQSIPCNVLATYRPIQAAARVMLPICLAAASNPSSHLIFTASTMAQSKHPHWCPEQRKLSGCIPLAAAGSPLAFASSASTTI